jgi:hypothetical protein
VAGATVATTLVTLSHILITSTLILIAAADCALTNINGMSRISFRPPMFYFGEIV